ncbi:SMC-Scp complex subunit ScpB, partial [Myxococcota bacterium]|nr:SMC-Scp complex subunit ScpB [Myxococcota bacterium]
MPLGEERLCSIIESLLLVSAEPVPLSRLVEVIRTEDPGTESEAIFAAVQLVVERYRMDRPVARGFRVEDVGGALQLRTVPENAPYVRGFLSAKPQRLSKPALETLAIIAYRQPVTKPEIEAVRGVDSGAVLKQLLERDLVRIIGKREEVGRPIIYGTTKYFLEFFGVRSLAELPTLREYHELDEENQREVDALHAPPQENKLSDLASAAQFLVEVKDDPDLTALDDAVAEADRARRAADFALDPTAGAAE